MLRPGQLRSTRFTGGKAWYLAAVLCIMVLLLKAGFDERILRKCSRQVLAFYRLNF
jgi:hypothetical protein